MVAAIVMGMGVYLIPFNRVLSQILVYGGWVVGGILVVTVWLMEYTKDPENPE